MPIHYDKKLTSKIKNSLKNYEVRSYDNNHWLDLKGRLDAQKKPFYVQYTWVMGFVGSIFIFTLVGLGFYPKVNSSSNLLVNNVELENNQPKISPAKNDNTPFYGGSELEIKTNSEEKKQEIQVQKSAKVENLVKKAFPNTTVRTSIALPIVKNTLLNSTKNTALNLENKSDVLLAALEVDSKLKTEFALLAKAHIDVVLKETSLELRKFDSFPSDSILEKPTHFEFGLSLSPLLYSNRDEYEPTKSFTLEGGIHTEWGLGKNRNLKFGTALLLSKNKLAHKVKTTTARTVPDPTDTKNADYTANFLILNIPLYFRYDFGDNTKSNFFVSGGLSNYTYVRESYNYTLKYLEEVYDPEDPSVIIGRKPATFKQKEVKVFSQWNFLSTIDLSMGVRTPLGQKNSLLISPYLRLPIKDLASENVRFSTIGLHLQLNLAK